MMSSLRGVIDAAALRVAAGKAATLVEALPWLARFRRAPVVGKYGGHAHTEVRHPRALASGLAAPLFPGLELVVSDSVHDPNTHNPHRR